MLASSNASIDQADVRLLVMGAERVGKSAAIVRFTTGRFIHQYCPSTQDWLYRHQLSTCRPANGTENTPAPPPPVLIELLEQKDLQINSENNDEDQRATTTKPECSSLALRAASDQRADRELRECQQLAGKLRWANAHVIVYSLTNSHSFDKAREYLELLDWMYSGDGATCSHVQARKQQQSKLSQRPTTASQHHLGTLVGPQRPDQRPPVLLLGNKHDLASARPETRQVTPEQGHELAAEHGCLFAELSTSACGNSIRNVLLALIGRALPPPVGPLFTLEHSTCPTSQRLTQLIKWQPNHHVLTPITTTCNKPQPAWSSLIKTQMPLVSSSHSTQVDGARLGGGFGAREATTHSQPVAATCESLVASSSCGSAQQAPPPPPSQPSIKQSSPTNASRYGALKSTFKKASLAIVSGKSLAARVSGRNSTGDAPPPIAALKRNSTTSSTLSELVSEHSQSVRGSIGSLSSTTASSSAGVPALAATASTSGECAPSKLNRSSNWIKSRFSRHESSGSEGKSSQSAIVSNTCELQRANEQQPAGGKFKRPLFKYKARLKTVAFEPSFGVKTASVAAGPTRQSSESIQTITTGSLDGSTSARRHQQQQQQNRASGTTSPLSSVSSSSRSSAPPLGATHNPNRRSSSSLSTSDTYYSSLFVVCQANSGNLVAQPERPPASASASDSPSSCGHAPTAPPCGGNPRRQDSRSTLSRASTSMGSYDEMLEEMESAASECVAPAPPAAATPPSRKISADKPPVGAASMKTRFQVVKTMQSTLTSLAKSTRATVSPAHPVKRSFCSALMNTSVSLAGPRVCVAATAVAPIQQLAKIEPIRAIPTVVGYCK